MKIDWDYWEQMLLVDLRDAVALSLEIDPLDSEPSNPERGEAILLMERAEKYGAEWIHNYRRDSEKSVDPGGFAWFELRDSEKPRFLGPPGGITWATLRLDYRFADACRPLEGPTFEKRLMLAESHAANGMLQTQDGRVWLSTFAHWALSLSVKWNIPHELAKLAKPTGDEALQQRANELAAKLKDEGVADPTRRAVARELAKSTPGKSEERIERIIRKQW